MTYAQWLWEYEAARKKEEEDINNTMEVLKLLKITLIRLLGLDLLVDKLDEEVPGTSYTPMSLMVSRREVVDTIFKKLEEEAVIQKTMNNDEFEQLSAAIARGENVGDMDPIVSDIQQDTVKELLRKEELEAIGIKVVDEPISASHIQFDNTDALNRSKDMLRELNVARKSVDTQLKQERLNQPTIKFDENA
jgi:hypothetical protein